MLYVNKGLCVCVKWSRVIRMGIPPMGDYNMDKKLEHNPTATIVEKSAIVAVKSVGAALMAEAAKLPRDCEKPLDSDLVIIEIDGARVTNQTIITDPMGADMKERWFEQSRVVAFGVVGTKVIIKLSRHYIKQRKIAHLALPYVRTKAATATLEKAEA